MNVQTRMIQINSASEAKFINEGTIQIIQPRRQSLDNKARRQGSDNSATNAKFRQLGHSYHAYYIIHVKR